MVDAPRRINFDYAAGYPVDPEVLETMLPYFSEKYGNPSSLHTLGGEVRGPLTQAQTQVGELIGAESPDKEIFFTSGATESNNLALKGFGFRNQRKGDHIIISSIEHISTINIAKYMKRTGFNVTMIPVDKYGVVNLNALEKAITDKTILISIMYANNELGTIQPIREAGRIAHEKKITFHVDATVAAGKIPIDVVKDNIDLLTASSNDIYGPKGVGALYVKLGTVIEPILQGGGQQRGLRSGTENIPGYIGFGKAADLAKRRMPQDSKYISALRDKLVKGVLESIEESYLHGHPTNRLPDLALLRMFGVEGEAILTELDRDGIFVSTGSACASKTLAPSHVLEAIGLNEIQRHGAIQFSLSRLNREEDVNQVVSLLPDVVKRLRDISPVWRFKDRFLQMYSSAEEEEEHVHEGFDQF
ncbi:MAG: cysteine desulfurase [Thaumarchaeota archaeon]|nr:cysteine desulfurase [Nitrososphaerota archaeon]MCL5317089.1 cysteine desulfurase [Nitrososphaerota archaeon]